MTDDAQLAALRELRVTRRRTRTAELEWFEALYRVYLAAIVGGGVLLLSGLVSDAPVNTEGLADALDHGPRLLGLLVVGALALGARNGADGGPLALEHPEVNHVLLARLGGVGRCVRSAGSGSPAPRAW
jgi:hypothetical protein